MRKPKNLISRFLFVGASLCASLVTPSLRADYSNTVGGFGPVGYWRFNETVASPAMKISLKCWSADEVPAVARDHCTAYIIRARRSQKHAGPRDILG